MKTLMNALLVIVAAVAIRPYVDAAEEALVGGGLRIGQRAEACERSLRQVREAADNALRVAQELI
ncbi:MAG: hypothetical protein HYY18_17320 [Planctomycetes bacterium]|nr:hypothetical protein [Planctomycetota bacterium]